MKEITGAGGPSNLSDIAAQRVRTQRASSSLTGSAAQMKRATDDVHVSINGRAMDALKGDLVRTGLVNRITNEINDPGYDLDGKLEQALDRVFATL